MKNCPTCGQPILPSMGERVARSVDAAQAKTSGIRPTLTQAAPDNVTLTLHVGNSASSVRTETTPRGYKGQHVIKRDQRYRLRVALLSFPRKGTMGGKLTIVPLGSADRKPTVYELPEQPTTHPAAPYTHEFKVMTGFGDQELAVPVKIVLVVA